MAKGFNKMAKKEEEASEVVTPIVHEARDSRQWISDVKFSMGDGSGGGGEMSTRRRATEHERLGRPICRRKLT